MGLMLAPAGGAQCASGRRYVATPLSAPAKSEQRGAWCADFAAAGRRVGVKSRVIIGTLMEEIGVSGIPSLERINRRGMFKRSLRNVMIVEHRIADESVAELLA